MHTLASDPVLRVYGNKDVEKDTVCCGIHIAMCMCYKHISVCVCVCVLYLKELPELEHYNMQA